ncbi:hypothetical protein NA57DRAFT_33572 [Rhizodiscina lignyota]|uniref:GPN-loop GTPase 2 n=1 Tax=Rhizodiscina lignyota TaxID=1504668 RepID=A0A9P4IKE5_9PEZI|nr:hypothetical protein NA57DRAFT_33572 [Rhizodiscina lignyota]
MPFAQLVIGPPGSGKSTYCDGLHQFMSAIGRPCSVVNLDPANDHVSYKAALDVRDLVSLEEVMEAEELGPNGGILYGLEELEHNFEWLEEGLKQLGDDYVLFDCPGQVELFTHHSSLRNVFFRLQKLGYRLVVINLIDSYVLTQPSLYISALLLALRSMLQMDLPHLNVLTKIDNLASYPPLNFNLDFYTEVQDLNYLLPYLDAERPHLATAGAKTSKSDPPPSKFHALNAAIIELVTDFGLVGFETLAVEDRQSMATLLRAVDRAGGYAFGPAEGANSTVWEVAMREGATTMEPRDVQERWIDRREEFDELERKQWEEEGKALRGGPAAEQEEQDQKMENQLDEDSDPEMRQLRNVPLQDSGIKIIRKDDPR